MQRVTGKDKPRKMHIYRGYVGFNWQELLFSLGTCGPDTICVLLHTICRFRRPNSCTRGCGPCPSRENKNRIMGESTKDIRVEQNKRVVPIEELRRLECDIEYVHNRPR